MIKRFTSNMAPGPVEFIGTVEEAHAFFAHYFYSATTGREDTNFYHECGDYILEYFGEGDEVVHASLIHFTDLEAVKLYNLKRGDHFYWSDNNEYEVDRHDGMCTHAHDSKGKVHLMYAPSEVYVVPKRTVSIVLTHEDLDMVLKALKEAAAYRLDVLGANSYTDKMQELIELFENAD